jgi:hypothetical protein
MCCWPCLAGQAYGAGVPHAMLCCVVLCYAMLCYAMLCYAMLCYAMLCYAMLCYAMLCYAASLTLQDPHLSTSATSKLVVTSCRHQMPVTDLYRKRLTSIGARPAACSQGDQKCLRRLLASLTASMLLLLLF